MEVRIKYTRIINVEAIYTASRLFFFLFTRAYAETIVSCGETNGQAYYFETPLLNDGDVGWTDDGISDGAIALVRSGEEWDILTKDSIGMISASSQGAGVYFVDAYGAFITLLVNYPSGSKELYTFDLQRNQVTWSQHKFGVTFDKAHTMIGTCE